MADKKLSELTSITSADIASGDLLLVSDVSAGISKSITYGELTTINSVDINGGTIDGTVIGGTTPAAGSFTTGSFTGDATFADNAKAIFGAGSDLQIYHSGTNSIVRDTGQGDLYLAGDANVYITNSALGEFKAAFITDGAASLYYDNAAKLATTATGVDVTGTVTADGLTFGAEGQKIEFFTSSTPRPFITSGDTYQTNGLDIDSDNGITLKYDNNDNGAGGVIIKRDSDNKNVFQADANGDISFYDAGGSSQSFYWDAANERLGIGITNVDATLQVGALDTTGSNRGAVSIKTEASDATIGESAIYIEEQSGAEGYYIGVESTGGLFFSNSGQTTPTLFLGDDNNVGIGTSSPSAKLHTVGSIRQTDAATETNALLVSTSGSSSTIETRYGTPLIFGTNATEAMRLDASGNLLVGTTNSSATLLAATSGGGIAFSPNSVSTLARESAASNQAILVLNQTGVDSELLQFRKDGTTVGSIGVDSGDNLYIGGSASSHAGLYFGTRVAAPLDAGTLTDDVMDLGSATYRFDDVYATNGTIQTSDRNEKQDIAELDEAEKRVAIAAKGLLRKFRWKSAVEEKGDEARIHFGIIAQDLQAAFAAEGLDAGDYAMFIHSTWTDEETGEERSRMGVRYSELLAFIIAAI